MDIAKEIYDYLVTTFEIEVDADFDEDVNLFENGYVDSLDAMAIVAELKRRFGIEITQRDLMLYPMNTINELADVVRIKQGG